MKVLLVDNYDSFTYNLQHYLAQCGAQVEVRRNDALSLAEVALFERVVLSPGPGLPEAAGLTLPLIEHYGTEKPILGVCLGCQALAQYAGGRLYNQQEVAHGIQRRMHRKGPSWLLEGLPAHLAVGLYHSWAVEAASLAAPWRCTAFRDTGALMALEHETLPLAGVQFHPESIMSEQGLRLLQNWLAR
ncbi:MAG: aminodeoxychorismate/anthranilate synthase component II [Schleiferiaceae bacterium]|nr:aminodeoxychorismate/anthranilate synthase component II [Schleiferiaceae bacterium]